MSVNQLVTNPVIVNPVEQTKAAGHLKPTYGFVSTKDVIDAFAKQGWHVVESKVSRALKSERQGFQKHLIILENPNFPSIPGLTSENASRPRLCLLNSHDGTTAYRMFIGLLRFACLNGIISGTALRDFKAVHSKNVLNRLGEGIQYLAANMSTLFDQVQALQSIQFTESMIKEYAKTLYDARLANVGKVLSVDYTVPILRAEDNATDGFTVFNRIQERLIRGGIAYTYQRDVKDVNGNVVDTRIVHTHTRRLASIQGQLTLNRVAYDTALQLANVAKQAA